ncbi:glutathione S-transferase family protein [Aureimonas jatrophae]|uniref:Glutathione S-transferase n=1 Tax=Aureimonas jatrophae TaxID=1166073 RepID=A0A1H0GAD1_9HYPH|nr:glutathione S-transferase family protein [Aureimonas jatrophae]MBB3949485.1 glutathione S-transferase [Aureimonas jatrophae]SDO03836.1 Glutathione S-transferase [Aureimonas jatrophae]
MTIQLYDLVGADPARPFSPHCWKARMALAHKGLKPEVLPVRFPEVASLEGGGGRTVPLVRDGDTVVQDSFAIAEYLDDRYPDRPMLFEGMSGRALTRFVESWMQRAVHPYLVSVAVLDIHDLQDREGQAWFRAKREALFGKSLEEVQSGRTPESAAAFARTLEPLRVTLKRQPFLGGETPRFADHIVFGGFQWARVATRYPVLPEAGDPIHEWFERCLDLYDALGRRTPAAA